MLIQVIDTVIGGVSKMVGYDGIVVIHPFDVALIIAMPFLTMWIWECMGWYGLRSYKKRGKGGKYARK